MEPVLSQEATYCQEYNEKDALLQKQIKAAKKKQDIGKICVAGFLLLLYVIVVGTLMAMQESIGEDGVGRASAVVPITTLMLFGFPLLVFGLCMYFYYRHKIGLLKEQARRLYVYYLDCLQAQQHSSDS